MELGGPVWHISVASRGLPHGRALLEHQAESELAGVGDARLGEWREFTGRALHLRRRLSVAEQAQIGDVMDIRHTAEARARVGRLPARLRSLLPAELIAAEVAR